MYRRANEARSHQHTSARVHLGDSQRPSITVTRGFFDGITSDLVAQVRTLTQSLMERLGLQFDEVDQVLLLGGFATIPVIGAMVEELTAGVPLQVSRDRHLGALGAAVQACVTAASFVG